MVEATFSLLVGISMFLVAEGSHKFRSQVTVCVAVHSRSHDSITRATR